MRRRGGKGGAGPPRSGRPNLFLEFQDGTAWWSDAHASPSLKSPQMYTTLLTLRVAQRTWKAVLGP